MNIYTYHIEFDISIEASDDEIAKEKANEFVPYDAKHELVELDDYEEISRDEAMADQINDERRLGL